MPYQDAKNAPGTGGGGGGGPKLGLGLATMASRQPLSRLENPNASGQTLSVLPSVEHEVAEQNKVSDVVLSSLFLVPVCLV